MPRTTRPDCGARRGPSVPDASTSDDASQSDGNGDRKRRRVRPSRRDHPTRRSMRPVDCDRRRGGDGVARRAHRIWERVGKTIPANPPRCVRHRRPTNVDVGTASAPTMATNAVRGPPPTDGAPSFTGTARASSRSIHHTKGCTGVARRARRRVTYGSRVACPPQGTPRASMMQGGPRLSLDGQCQRRRSQLLRRRSLQRVEYRISAALRPCRLSFRYSECGGLVCEPRPPHEAGRRSRRAP